MLYHVNIDPADTQAVPPPSPKTIGEFRKCLSEARYSGSAEIIPDYPMRLVMLKEVPGAALFTINLGEARMVTGAAYWTLDGEAAALKWQFADRRQPGPSIASGEYLPGLLTRLEPGASGVSLEEETATWLDDCAQCIAWTLAREGAQ